MGLGFTNSLTNFMLSGTKGQPDPEVGMGATKLMYTDRHACTIVEVKGKTIGIQRDNAVRTDNNGMTESQDYEYSPNVNAPIEYFTQRKNGAWVKAKESMRGGTRLRIGERKEYYDYSF